jgi:heme exporter protein D
MHAAVSALLLLATFLAAWTAVAVASVPILVLCVRSQARANARLTRGLERRAWAAARRG